jgi:hypothetical protein
MTHGTEFKLVNLLVTENPNFIKKNLNTSIEKLKNRWNIHLVLYYTSTVTARTSSSGQLSFCAWRFGIFDKSHRYKTKTSVGWQIAINGRIGFTLQLTATPAFHSLYDW